MQGQVQARVSAKTVLKWLLRFWAKVLAKKAERRLLRFLNQSFGNVCVGEGTFVREGGDVNSAQCGHENETQELYFLCSESILLTMKYHYHIKGTKIP